MVRLPEKTQQIVQTHAALINMVVRACGNRQLEPELEPVLQASAANGWTELVAAIRKILAGSRDMRLLKGLDEEDGVIVEAILRGLQDPATLPNPTAQPDPVMAGPGLAAMIHAATRGDVGALSLVANMAEQMQRIGGDMARLAAAISRMVHGERDADRLSQGMGMQARELVLQILDELARNNLQ